MKALNAGFIELEDAFGDDLAVVNAARVSFAAYSAELDERGKGLIRYLMSNGHGTPFEHAVFKFRVKAPLFVAREWMRHRIGSYNEWSQRYSTIENDFYVPSYVRTQVGKPGAYSYEIMSEQDTVLAQQRIRAANEAAYEAYADLLRLGVARELAARVLPTTVYTLFVWTVNARSLMNFLALRNSPHAQHEIRVYAQLAETIFAERMPTTHAAFVAAGRTAP